MYLLQRSMKTETAHLLVDHPGECKNIHGHSYEWTVTISASYLVDDMVIDFSLLKQMMEDVIGKYDHAFIVDDRSIHDFKVGALENMNVLMWFDGRPTAERFAELAYRGMKKHICEANREQGDYDRLKVVSVACRETSKNKAIYFEDKK